MSPTVVRRVTPEALDPSPVLPDDCVEAAGVEDAAGEDASSLCPPSIFLSLSISRVRLGCLEYEVQKELRGGVDAGQGKFQ